MKAKSVFSCAVILTVVGATLVRADPPVPPPPAPLPVGTPGAGMGLPGAAVPTDATLVVPAAPGDSLAAPGAQPHHGLSDWIKYTCPDCCGPIGGDGPINTVLFVRSGVSLPVEGPIFGHTLQTGWEIEGGGRSVFFNPTLDRDWAIDLSISNIWNHGQHSDFVVALPRGPGEPDVGRSIHDLNRTYVNAGLGRDWYIWGPANACGCKWVWGIDAGGRLGSAKVDFNAFPHKTDVISGVFVALHSEVEHSCGCCTFTYGFRAVWDYTWMDILTIRNDSDLMDVDLLLTAGVRF